MEVFVWSERDEPYGEHRWRDCTYSTVLMALVWGGFTSFPLGIYTVAEREAFERADDRPDETGGNYSNTDMAIEERYGAKYALGRWGGTLNEALHTANLGLCVQGLNAVLPTNLRRWDPSFAGAHSVFCIPQGDGYVRWLDPEATWKYGGELVAATTVMKWSGALSGAGLRVVKRDQFLEKPVLEFDILDMPHGFLTVKSNPGIRYVTLLDGVTHAAGYIGRKRAIPINLRKPLLGAVAGEDRQTAYLIGQNPAVLLAKDVDFAPDPDIRVAVNLAVDHVAAAVPALTNAINEARLR